MMKLRAQLCSAARLFRWCASWSDRRTLNEWFFFDILLRFSLFCVCYGPCISCRSETIHNTAPIVKGFLWIFSRFQRLIITFMSPFLGPLGLLNRSVPGQIVCIPVLLPASWGFRSTEAAFGPPGASWGVFAF